MQTHINALNQTWPHSIAWLLGLTSAVILAVQCADTINSNDLWWHMALGRYILETGTLIVNHSVFTWTYATHYIVYNAWLAEIIFYLTYHQIGVGGLIALRYIVHGGFFVLAIYFAIQRNISFNPLTWVIIILGTALTFATRTINAELFSFAFMVITVWLYFSIRSQGTTAWKLCYWFPVIMTIWVNTHGAFVISSFFFLSVIIGELLNSKFSPSLAMPVKLQKHLFLALALCIPALLLNPFGYALPFHLIAATTSFSSELPLLSTSITGWDPTFNYNVPPYYALDYLILTILIFVFLVWQRIKHKQVDWVTIITFISYSVLYVQMLRTTHFLGPVFVFASLDLLKHKDNSWAWPSTKMVKIAITTGAVTIVGLVGLRSVQGAVCYSHFGYLTNFELSSRYPVEEVEYIRHRPDIKRLGNVYNSGGYLMFMLWPNVLHLIDQRYFPFTSWFEEYARFENGEGVQEFLAQHKADAWLIPSENTALMDWFSSSKTWTPWFVGPNGVVFGPNLGPPVQPNISKNIEFTTVSHALITSFHTALDLGNWTLAKRIQSQTASLAINRHFCNQYATISSAIQTALTATQAFHNGDYVTAATSLKHGIPFEYLQGIAVISNTMLAKRAWNSGDYFHARAFAIDALRVAPKNVVSVYNAAIADWQYRNSITNGKVLVNDDLTWEFLANLLLTHEEKILHNRQTIVDVLLAMRNGTLSKKPDFINQ